MSVLKYKSPSTGEWLTSRSVKVIEEGGGGSAPVIASEKLTASGYPDYITPEVMDMVGRVNAVRAKNSTVFLAMSDSHYPADQTATTEYTNNKASSMQANRAAKVLSYLIRPDFFANFGDVCIGASTTTPDMLKKQIEEFNSYFREAKSDVPVFLCIGNHDTGIYYHNVQTDGKIYTMSGKYLYDNFTALSASDNTVFGDPSYGGYCYRDFPDKKLRVFMLNTSEKIVGMQSDSATYGAQRAWLADALLDLNGKDDAAEWKFIILSHHPADYGAIMPLSELLEAYVKGESHTVSDTSGDGTNETFDFSGNNGAKFVAQFHGHIHNFLTSKLYSDASGSPVQYDAWRICIPNVQFDRENTYGEFNGIDFSEDTSYPKTPNTADGTSFVVNVINPSEEKIYSFCYGAGYDRVVGFGGTVYYSVASKLTNVTSSNGSKSIEAGAAYSATLTPDENFSFKSVTVTMDGKDITDTAFKDGVVTISKVTGNIVITAKAQATPNFTNLVPLSVDKSGADFNVDGDGYDNDVYISTDDSGRVEVIKTRTGCTTTGYIPVTPGAKVIRVAGEGLSIDPIYTRIGYYDANFKPIVVISYKNMGTQHSTGVYYNGKLIDEPSTLFTVELEKVSNGANGVYIRVCVNGDGADLVVTVDEEVSYG
jgi:predicted MPP superfamily phosphohydrolase